MTDCDALIIGGGPAGLTAAIYLARFHLTTIVVDGGHSRAATIPRTRNHAGYPGGIPGPDLVAAMRTQASEYGARVIDDWLTGRDHDGEAVVARGAGGAAPVPCCSRPGSSTTGRRWIGACTTPR